MEIIDETMTLVAHTALAVKHFRKEAKLSQEELADRAGLDRTYISGVERGIRNITLGSLDNIIAALNVKHCTFLEFIIEAYKNELQIK